MKPRHANLALFAALAVGISPLCFTGCATRTLDPVGVYAGDTVLFELDGAITSTADFFQAAVAWADRNPEYVAAHANVAEAVAKIRAEIDGVPVDSETLEKLQDLRDAYQIAKTATPADVHAGIAQARTILETFRAVFGSNLTSP